MRAAIAEDESLENARIAADQQRKRDQRVKEREEETAERERQVKQREHELELMRAASRQQGASTPAKAKRGPLDGKEVTQKTQSLARVHEHNKELREREEARIEEAARRLEFMRLAEGIQRGE